MPKHAGAYKSQKRRKELDRLKKQEEKRQRRLNKGLQTEPEPEKTGLEEKGPEPDIQP